MVQPTTHNQGPLEGPREEMTQVELKEYKSVLEAKRVELCAALKASKGSIEIVTSADEMDQITNLAERNMSAGGIKRTTKQLRLVNFALTHIAQGKFGTCADCNQEINPKRLAAVPWATLCVSCQEKVDEQEEDPDEDTIPAVSTVHPNANGRNKRVPTTAPMPTTDPKINGTPSVFDRIINQRMHRGLYPAQYQSQ